MVLGTPMCTIWPLRSDCWPSLPASGSTPIDLASGDSARAASAQPASRPPPPSGTARHPAADLVEQFLGGRALACDHVRVVVGRNHRHAALLREARPICLAVFGVAVVDHHFAAVALGGAHLQRPARPCGMTITAGMPSRLADSAMACAWLPDEKVSTPPLRWARSNFDMALKAPRNLKAPMRWKFSHLKKNWAPQRSSAVLERSTGVRWAWPSSR
jgi:hypothetical protein